MDIHFNYVHVSASDSLEELTREKLNKLKDYYDFIVSADVYFKKEKTTNPDEKETTANPHKNKACEIQLNLPGPGIFISAIEENFDKALYKNINDLKRQLRKRKEKMNTHRPRT